MKAMSKDSQIILNMYRIQDLINDIIDDKEDSEVAEDSTKVSALSFYILKMYAMRKNFSGKTKKALSFFDDDVEKIIIKSMSFCYPMISDTEIVRVARGLADMDNRLTMAQQYELCIKESYKYQGD